MSRRKRRRAVMGGAGMAILAVMMMLTAVARMREGAMAWHNFRGLTVVGPFVVLIGGFFFVAGVVRIVQAIRSR